MSPTGPSSLASLDGQIMLASEASIPVTDDGLIRGDGAFEVVRIYDGLPFAMDAHLARLERSGRNLRLAVDLEAVRADAHRLLAHASRAGGGDEHQALRIILTRGGRRLLLTESLPETPATVRLGSIRYAPTILLDGVKSLSYGANMLARRLAVEAGFDDALLVTPEGVVLEGPTSTIFWVRDATLQTTPLEDHVLASITRALIGDVAGLHERRITLDELRAADEVFLASTGSEVLPVAAVDDQRFATDGPVTARTRQAVQTRIAAELAELAELAD